LQVKDQGEKIGGNRSLVQRSRRDAEIHHREREMCFKQETRFRGRKTQVRIREPSESSRC